MQPKLYPTCPRFHFYLIFVTISKPGSILLTCESVFIPSRFQNFLSVIGCSKLHSNHLLDGNAKSLVWKGEKTVALLIFICRISVLSILLLSTAVNVGLVCACNINTVKVRNKIKHLQLGSRDDNNSQKMKTCFNLWAGTYRSKSMYLSFLLDLLPQWRAFQ